MLQESKGYTIFPSAQSIRQCGLFGIESDENDVSTTPDTYLPQCIPVNTRYVSFDDLDSFIERNMNELDHVGTNRNDVKTDNCDTNFPGEERLESATDKSWEDAIVDCRIDLPDESVGSEDPIDVTEGCYMGRMDMSFYRSVRGNSIIYDVGSQDMGGITYRPSSNGLHRSYHSSHIEECDFEDNISPTRCFSRISNGIHMNRKLSNPTNDKWMLQPIVPLSDKAIASAFSKHTNMDTETLLFDSYTAHFYNVEASSITEEPTNPTVATKGDWKPRDIKMCSPFKACRGEVTKITKSGGPIHGDASHSKPRRILDTAPSTLEGLFVVIADSDMGTDVDSYEHLYKAEFDLLIERKEYVDIREMEEWRYQAGLRTDQIGHHHTAFNRFLRLHCKHFGRRVYPYRGELDSLASKSIHVLDPHTKKFEVGIMITKTYRHDIRRTKKRHPMDMGHFSDSIPDEPLSGRFSNIAAIQIPTHRLFDYETDIRRIPNSSVKAEASNTYQLYGETIEDGFKMSPSIGIRHAFSDFQMSPKDDRHFKASTNLQQMFTFQCQKETNMIPDATSANRRNFTLKILLRFPYLDLKQLGLTTF